MMSITNISWETVSRHFIIIIVGVNDVVVVVELFFLQKKEKEMTRWTIIFNRQWWKKIRNQLEVDLPNIEIN